MNVQAQKAIIIEQFKQLDDINLLNAIKKLPEYAREKEKEIFDIPEAHQKIVLERYEKVRQ